MKNIINRVFLVILCIFPFSTFLLVRTDSWHAFGYFLQTGILILYSLKLFKFSKPFASFFFWSGALAIFYWINIEIQTGKYAVSLLLPYFNFVCMAVFFDILVNNVTKPTYEKFLKCLVVTTLIMVVYAFLQCVNLDQFQKNIYTLERTHTMLGTIGHPTHLAHYLCMCLPAFFVLKQPWNKLGTLLILLVILSTRSTSGLLIFGCVVVFYSCFHRLFTWREFFLMIVFAGIFLVHKYKTIYMIKCVYFETGGRFEMWQHFYGVFKEKSIVGWGIGIVNELAKTKEFYQYRHVHLELFHFAIETGVIGLGIIIWGIIDYFRRLKRDKVSIVFSSMFLAFFLSSFFGFPAHLWLLAGLGLISYSYKYKVEAYSENPCRN